MKMDDEFSTHFSSLKKLLNRVNDVLSQETSFMSSFWNDELKCFSLYPQLQTSRVSITTTCFALTTIMKNSDNWKNIVAWEYPGVEEHPAGGTTFRISVKEICNSLDAALSSSTDPFQLPVLIHTLTSLRAVNVDDPSYLIAVERIIDQRSRLSLHRQQNTSSYLRYQNAKALMSIVNSDLVPSKVKGTNRIGYALERSNLVGFDELCRQIAFYQCGDSAFDVVTTIYSFLIYWDTSLNPFLTSFARGFVPSINLKLCATALEIIFKSQSNDGTWSKGEPIFSSGNARTRDMGNNYCFYYDFLADLLDKVSDKHPELLAPYLPQIELSLRWAEDNVLEEMLPEECDNVTGRCYGTLVKGWRSNHLGNGGAVSWCTSLVFSGIASMRKLLEKLITHDILTEFSGKMALAERSAKDWNSLMDADLLLSVNYKTTLKKELFSRLLQPQVEKETTSQRAFQKPFEEVVYSERQPLFSLILFGPPGTLSLDAINRMLCETMNEA